MSVLVDSSVWIEYFRGSETVGRYLDYFLDENEVVTNNCILTELIPLLKIHHQHDIIRSLQALRCLPVNIQWEQLQDYQWACMKEGFNGIGIIDLMIAQNAKDHHCVLYSLDRHFQNITGIVGIQVLS